MGEDVAQAEYRAPIKVAILRRADQIAGLPAGSVDRFDDDDCSIAYEWPL